jgi:hypothetical protein
LQQISKHEEEEPKPYRINKTKPINEAGFDNNNIHINVQGPLTTTYII